MFFNGWFDDDNTLVSVDFEVDADLNLTAGWSLKDSTPPAKPTNIQSTAEDGKIILNWTNPGDSDLAKIIITYKIGADTKTIEVTGDDLAIAAKEITGLTNGTKYEFSVKAVDKSGNESEPVTVKATPTNISVPPKPADIQATPLDGKIKITWTTPTDPAITKIVITYKVGNDNRKIEISGTDLETGFKEITDLSNNTEYEFMVTAENEEGGESESTKVTAKPEDKTPPAEVKYLNATVLEEAIQLTWTKPTDSDLAKIIITYTPGTNEPIEITGADLATGNKTITGLTNGTEYTFVIKTVDTAGNESEGITKTATPVDSTPPDEVGLLNTVVQDESIKLTWTKPNSSDLAKIVITYTPGNNTPIEITGTDLDNCEKIITGLTNGTEYSFLVKTVDETGNVSLGSIVKATPKDITPPAAPGSVTAIGYKDTIKIKWTNPTDADLKKITISYNDGESHNIDITNTELAAGEKEITGLTNDTEYTFTIKAVDNAGNASSAVTVKGTPENLYSITSESSLKDFLTSDAELCRLDSDISITLTNENTTVYSPAIAFLNTPEIRLWATYEGTTSKTLDMNSHTISITYSANSHFYIFSPTNVSLGTIFTVKDSSDAKTGKIEATDTRNQASASEVALLSTVNSTFHFEDTSIDCTGKITCLSNTSGVMEAQRFNIVLNKEGTSYYSTTGIAVNSTANLIDGTITGTNVSNLITVSYAGNLKHLLGNYSLKLTSANNGTALYLSQGACELYEATIEIIIDGPGNFSGYSINGILGGSSSILSVLKGTVKTTIINASGGNSTNLDLSGKFKFMCGTYTHNDYTGYTVSNYARHGCHIEDAYGNEEYFVFPNVLELKPGLIVQ